MPTIPVNIFFSGLIAFVPTPVDAGAITSVTALVPDESGYNAVGGDCKATHYAAIRFWYDPTACLAQGCIPQDGVCACSLAQDVISIGPSVVPLSHGELHRSPPVPVPLPPQAGDFSSVVNMANLDTDLNIGLLNQNGQPQPSLAAIMSFPFQSLTTCSYVQFGNVLDFDFKQPGTHEYPQLSQALALSMMATTNVTNPQLATVTLTLTKPGGSYRTFTLAPEVHESCYSCVEFLVMNERPMSDNDNDPCLTNGIGFDFEFYYQLATGQPEIRIPYGGMVDGPLVRIAGSTTETLPLLPVLCSTALDPEEYTSPYNRPVCPMAAFFP